MGDCFDKCGITTDFDVDIEGAIVDEALRRGWLSRVVRYKWGEVKNEDRLYCLLEKIVYIVWNYYFK
jgi:hypothetical protein